MLVRGESVPVFHHVGVWGLNSGHRAWQQVPLSQSRLSPEAQGGGQAQVVGLLCDPWRGPLGVKRSVTCVHAHAGPSAPSQDKALSVCLAPRCVVCDCFLRAVQPCSAANLALPHSA